MQVLARPSGADSAEIVATVTDILHAVKTGGDEAVREYSMKFDAGWRKNFACFFERNRRRSSASGSEAFPRDEAGQGKY